MSIVCQACGEENRDSALVCELCQALLKPAARPVTPVARPVTPTPRPVTPVARPATPAPRPVTPPVKAVKPAPAANEAEPPPQTHTGQPAVLYIPAVPPRQGHGGTIAAGIIGAAVALIAVAALKLTGKPQPAPVASPQPARQELVYVQVPVAVPAPAADPVFLPAAAPTQPAPSPMVRAPEPPRAAEPLPARSNQITVPYHGQDARTQRILVPITVNGTATVMFALDTGAQPTLISQPLADHLGVLRSDEGRLLTGARGIGGSAPAVLVVLDSLTLGDAREEFVPATVTASLSDNFEGLLGMDFITTFNLKIDTARQVLVLTKPESNAKTPGGHHEHWWRRLFHQFKDQKKGWEGFRDQLDRRLAESQISEGASIETLRRVRAITDNQVQEAEKLQSRLERHASNHSVPREWR